MKLFFTLLFIVAFYSFSFSQNLFEIRNVGENYSRESINSAILNADWCGFYYSDRRRVLNFDDGTVVEFLSAEEIQNKGANLDINCYSDFIKNDDKTYLIHSTGRILIKVEKNKSIKTTIVK